MGFSHRARHPLAASPALRASGQTSRKARSAIVLPARAQSSRTRLQHRSALPTGAHARLGALPRCRGSMVDIQLRERTVKVKIVYYGPAVGGKTTNLKVLYERARGGAARAVRLGQLAAGPHDPLRPAAAAVGRLPRLRPALQLVAVPGQAIYAPTRRVVLRGRTGSCSSPTRPPTAGTRTCKSCRRWSGNLLAQQLDPSTIPIVFQYNKRDLPDVIEIEALSRVLNGRRAPEFAAVATRGEGVLETFADDHPHAIEGPAASSAALQLPDGPDGRELDGAGDRAMFGADSFDAPPPEPVEPPSSGSRRTGAPVEAVRPLKLQIPTPESSRRRGRPRRRRARRSRSPSPTRRPRPSSGSSSTTCARSATSPGSRLDEMPRALELASRRPGKIDIEERVQRILRILVVGRSGGATLLLVADRVRRRSWCCRRSSPTRCRARSGARRTSTSCATSRSRGSRRPVELRASPRRCARASPSFEAVCARAAALGRARARARAPLLRPAHGAADARTRSCTSASWRGCWRVRSRPRRRARRASTADRMRVLSRAVGGGDGVAADAAAPGARRAASVSRSRTCSRRCGRPA